MLRKTIKKLTAWACVLAAFLMGIVPRQGLVVCICSERAVTLAVASTPEDGCSCCKSPDVSTTGTESKMPTCSGHCECIDLQLAPSDPLPKDRPEKSPELSSQFVACLDIAPGFEVQPHTSAPRYREAAPRAPPDLRMIRTVVLRM